MFCVFFFCFIYFFVNDAIMSVNKRPSSIVQLFLFFRGKIEIVEKQNWSLFKNKKKLMTRALLDDKFSTINTLVFPGFFQQTEWFQRVNQSIFNVLSPCLLSIHFERRFEMGSIRFRFVFWSVHSVVCDSVFSCFKKQSDSIRKLQTGIQNVCQTVTIWNGTIHLMITALIGVAICDR